MRWLPFVLIAVAGVAAVVARNSWSFPQSATARFTAAAPRFESDLAPRIFAGGVVEGTHRELTLRFEVPGRIKAVHVQPGDAVHTGDVLTELDSEVAELGLAEASLRLRIAVAERDQLIADARRLARHLSRDVVPAANGQPQGVEALFEQRGPTTGGPAGAGRNDPPTVRTTRERTPAPTAPPTDLSREEHAIADGKIALAEAAVRRERLLVDKHRLRAPADGVVLRTGFEPGELTGPTDAGAELIFVNRDVIHVRAFVEELDALNVSPGQCAVVSAASSPGQGYTGVVRSCSPDVRPKSHRHLKPGERLDVRVREVVIELDDGADLLIGLPVEVFIEPPLPEDHRPHDDREPDRR